MFSFFLLFLSVSTANGHNHRPFEPWGLEVSSQDKTATITWQRPDAGSYTGFWLRLFSPLNGESEGLDLNDDDDIAILRQLKPNTTYNLELYTVLDNTLSEYASTRTFTTLPAEPQDIFATEITETTITVRFNTSSFSDNPNRRYIFTISPTLNNDPASDFLYFLEDSSRTFDRLVPGRLYTISGYTAINEELSNPKIAQFRTVPLSPTINHEFQQHSSMPTSFHVYWYPPNNECDFERYHVTVYWYGNDDDENYKHRVTTFVAHSSIESHKFNNLPHEKKFHVHIRTVSGVGTTTEQFSKPLILAVTNETEASSASRL